MRRPLLVGQAPSMTSDPLEPLSGRPMRFLTKLTGWPEDAFMRLERANLLDRWPGRKGKGDLFPMQEARMHARAMAWSGAMLNRRVLLLGRGVAAAFDAGRMPYLTWYVGQLDPWPRRPFEVAVLPHPSGVNHWWNDHKNRDTARRFLLGMMEPEPCPQR